MTPTLSGSVKYPPSAGHIAAGSPRLRRFGDRALDLDIDLYSRARPHLVTALLAACLATPDGAPLDLRSIWEMSVGARIAWLLALADLEAPGPFAVPLRCPEPACGNPMEVELTLDEILAAAGRDRADPFWCEAGGARFLLRRPTGSDQAAWLDSARPDSMSGPDAILRSLIVEGPSEELSEAQSVALEAALDGGDPLLRFTLVAECPACGASSEHEAPLTDAALEVLRRAQAALIQDVHALALAYGWTEGQVLALPRWRRVRYLSLAGGGPA